MKIELKDEQDVLTLSDEDLDTNNFVDITIHSGRKHITMTVDIDELFRATLAFSLRQDIEDRDNITGFEYYVKNDIKPTVEADDLCTQEQYETKKT